MRTEKEAAAEANAERAADTGWEEHVDDEGEGATGKVYWFNIDTEESSWVRPDVLVSQDEIDEAKRMVELKRLEEDMPDMLG